MRILIIDEYIDNGKGFELEVVPYNLKYNLEKFDIKNNEIYYENNLFEIENLCFDIIIFNINEDMYGFQRNKLLLKKFKNNEDKYIEFCKKLSFLFKKKINNLNKKIFQDPEFIFDLRDKVDTYNKINQIKNKIVKCPKYKRIRTENDIENIEFYPLILKYSNSSHTNDNICKNEEELKKIYKKKKNKNNLFVVEFINSYIEELDRNHSVRFVCTGENIIDYYFRASNKWNIHTSDQDKEKVLEADLYFKSYYNSNYDELKNYMKDITKIFSEGFYVIDAILNNGNIYICEIGLKCIDPNNMRYLKNIIYKKSLDLKFMKEHYKKYFDSI